MQFYFNGDLTVTKLDSTGLTVMQAVPATTLLGPASGENVTMVELKHMVGQRS